MISHSFSENVKKQRERNSVCMKKAMQREEVVVAVYVEARVALKDYVSDTKTIVQKI